MKTKRGIVVVVNMHTDLERFTYAVQLDDGTVETVKRPDWLDWEPDVGASVEIAYSRPSRGLPAYAHITRLSSEPPKGGRVKEG